jgi:Mg2+-importing ATPase
VTGNSINCHSIINIINKKAQELASNGMQVIALAEKNNYPGINNFTTSDEKDMTLIGFVAFLDPPKSGVKETLKKLKKANVNIIILTGDNQYSTKCICDLVGLKSDKIMLGKELDKLTDQELKLKIPNIDAFARLNPLQKELYLLQKAARYGR